MWLNNLPLGYSLPSTCSQIIAARSKASETLAGFACASCVARRISDPPTFWGSFKIEPWGYGILSHNHNKRAIILVNILPVNHNIDRPRRVKWSISIRTLARNAVANTIIMLLSESPGQCFSFKRWAFLRWQLHGWVVAMRVWLSAHAGCQIQSEYWVLTFPELDSKSKVKSQESQDSSAGPSLEFLVSRLSSRSVLLVCSVFS